MSILLAIVIGGLFAASFYLMLRRSLARLIVGLALLTNAANLLIFTAGGLTRASPAIVPEGETAPTMPVADPLPQALVLTAIVIGFGILAFTMVLAYRSFQAVGSDDVDDLRTTDSLDLLPPRPIPALVPPPAQELAVAEPAHREG
jgi:multicomponent Na+:H+ antiporter subunit C